MVFRVLLSPLPNSHPFFERECPLDHPLKIGRSVAKFKSAQDNLIFDCKVLSRNHALLWEEGGKFYLKDTKSSNGTFVNRQRLSRSGDESSPVEVKAGDELQFGVDVIENKKVTHSCIIGTVTFISMDPSAATATIAKLETVSSRDLIELSQLLRSMKEKEQSLSTKLANIQDIVVGVESQAEHGFQTLLTEDQLLLRIEMLENQLQLYCEKYTEDELRHQLSELLDQKRQYEVKSKESLRRILQEKLEYASKLSEIQRNYDQSEEECEKMRNLYEKSQKNAEELADAVKAKETETLALLTETREVQEQLSALQQETDAENVHLKEQVTHLTGRESMLTVQVESLTAEVDFTKEQLAASRVKLEVLQTPVSKSTVGVQVSAESHDIEVQTDSKPITDQSTETVMAIFSDQDVQTECSEEDVSPVIPTPVTEQVELQQTALLYSEVSGDDSATTEDSSEDSLVRELQQQLAAFETRTSTLEAQKMNLFAELEELKFKLRDAESAAASSADVSQTLNQVWKQLNDANDENRRLTATMSQQRSEVDTVRNQLKTEQDTVTKEKAELEQMTRRNRLLSIQLTEAQDQLQKLEEKQTLAVTRMVSEDQAATDQRQKQRELLQKHLSSLNRKVKDKEDRIGILQNQLRDAKSKLARSHVSREMGVVLGVVAAVLAWFGLYLFSWIS